MDPVLLGFKAFEALMLAITLTGWLASGMPLPSIPEQPAAMHDAANVESAFLPVDEDW